MDDKERSIQTPTSHSRDQRPATTSRPNQHGKPECREQPKSVCYRERKVKRIQLCIMVTNDALSHRRERLPQPHHQPSSSPQFSRPNIQQVVPKRSHRDILDHPKYGANIGEQLRAIQNCRSFMEKFGNNIQRKERFGTNIRANRSSQQCEAGTGDHREFLQHIAKNLGRNR